MLFIICFFALLLQARFQPVDITECPRISQSELVLYQLQTQATYKSGLTLK